MAFGVEVGNAHVSIFASMKGVKSSINKEFSQAGKSGSNSFKKSFDTKSVGNKLGSGLKNSFKAGSQGLSEAVLKPFKTDVAKAANSYSSSLLKQRDAALNVKSAQDKLTEAIEKHGEGSLQAEKASVRLEQAELREKQAADNARTSSDKLAEAKERLKAVQDAAAGSSNRFSNSMNGITGQLKNVARALLGMNQFPQMTGKIGAFVKSGLTKISGFGAQIGSKMSTGLKGAVQATQNTLSGWGGKLGGLMTNVASHIPGPFKTAASGIGTYFGGVASAVGGALGKIPDGVKTIAGNIAAHFKAGAQKASQALQSIATVGMAGLATAATAAIPAIIGVGKSALSAYSTYEQAVGGVDTLFKDASQTVQDYAKNAYKTAGVSANDYMNQITSFSASLISSLGGDTAKAADMGNMALTDMSDNANKMGTGLGDIQNAYQGFAKQNYTMLDNLKLGYGGTKTEMQRLIGDANKLEKANGQAGDLTIDKFSDVVQAIHDVQDQMGITGTTSREAATTIEGSVGSMKAAWANWLTELGKDDADIPGLTNQLADSIGTALKNVIPRIGVIGKSIFASLPSIFSSAVSFLPESTQNVIGKIQGAFEQFKPIIATLGGAFAAVGSSGIAPLLGKIPLLGGVLGKLAGPLKMLGGPIGIITAALAGLIATSPQLQSVFGDVLMNIMSGLSQQFQLLQPSLQAIWDTLQTAMTTLMPVITQTVDALLPVIGQILTALLPLVSTILTPLLDVINTLIPPITQVIQAILPVLTQLIVGLAPAITSVIGVITDVIQTLIPILQPIIEMIASFITDVIIPVVQSMQPVVESVIGTITSVVQSISGVVQGVVDIISGIFSGDWNQVWNGIKEVVSNAVNGIGDLLSGMANIGKNLVEGLWNGISSVGSWIWDKISGFCGGIVDKIKGFFGIHSPSKLFRNEIGKMLGKGLAIGVDDSQPIVSKSVKRLTNIVPDNVTMGVDARTNTVTSSRPSNGQPFAVSEGSARIVNLTNKIDASGISDPQTMAVYLAEQDRKVLAAYGGSI